MTRTSQDPQDTSSGTESPRGRGAMTVALFAAITFAVASFLWFATGGSHSDTDEPVPSGPIYTQSDTPQYCWDGGDYDGDYPDEFLKLYDKVNNRCLSEERFNALSAKADKIGEAKWARELKKAQAKLDKLISAEPSMGGKLNVVLEYYKVNRGKDAAEEVAQANYKRIWSPQDNLDWPATLSLAYRERYGEWPNNPTLPSPKPMPTHPDGPQAAQNQPPSD